MGLDSTGIAVPPYGFCRSHDEERCITALTPLDVTPLPLQLCNRKPATECLHLSFYSSLTLSPNVV